MSRHFPNRMHDFVTGGKLHVDRDFFKSRIIEIVNTILSRQQPNLRDCDGGLYVGISGIGYMFYHLSQSPSFVEYKSEFLKHAEKYITVSLQYAQKHGKKKDEPGFLLGNGGVYAVGSCIYKALGDADASQKYARAYHHAADICTPVNFLSCGSDEFLVGRAGYLCGLKWLQDTLNEQILSDGKTFAICQAMIQAGTEYSKRHRSPSPLMYAYYDTEYLGAAHGMAGILLALLCYPECFQNDSKARHLIKDTVNFVLGLEQPNGNYPPAMDDVGINRGEHELVHWCHGAPGMVYLLAKAYLTYKDENYLKACIRCADFTWHKGLLKKGPGICHGVAGSGYVFLLLYRLTEDPKYLHRAVQFANFLFSEDFKQANTPDSPYSLYEGLAGTVCFLNDLVHHDRAAFPFFDVF